MARGGSAHPTGDIMGPCWDEVFSLQIFAEMKLEMVIDELEYAGKAFFPSSPLEYYKRTRGRQGPKCCSLLVRAEPLALF